MKSISFELLDERINVLCRWLAISTADNLLTYQFLFDEPFGRLLPCGGADVQRLPIQELRRSKIPVYVAGLYNPITDYYRDTVQYDCSAEQHGKSKDYEISPEH